MRTRLPTKSTLTLKKPKLSLRLPCTTEPTDTKLSAKIKCKGKGKGKGEAQWKGKEIGPKRVRFATPLTKVKYLKQTYYDNEIPFKLINTPARLSDEKIEEIDFAHDPFPLWGPRLRPRPRPQKRSPRIKPVFSPSLSPSSSDEDGKDTTSILIIKDAPETELPARPKGFLPPRAFERKWLVTTDALRSVVDFHVCTERGMFAAESFREYTEAKVHFPRLRGVQRLEVVGKGCIGLVGVGEEGERVEVVLEDV